MIKTSVEIERIGDPIIKHLRLDSSWWRLVGEKMAHGITDNIKRQTQHDGKPIKENSVSTKEKKRLAGRVLLSLADDPGQWRLFAYEKYNIEAENNGVSVSPKAQDIAIGVQERGYTGWMRPPAQYVRAEIDKLITKAIVKAKAVANSMRKRKRP